MRALVMHETQEPKKGVGAGETVEFSPLPLPKRTQFLPESSCLYSCQGDCLLLSPRVPDLKPIARPPENLLLAGLDTEWVEYMVQVLLIHYWAFKIFICTNPI